MNIGNEHKISNPQNSNNLFPAPGKAENTAGRLEQWRVEPEKPNNNLVELNPGHDNPGRKRDIQLTVSNRTYTNQKTADLTWPVATDGYHWTDKVALNNGVSLSCDPVNAIPPGKKCQIMGMRQCPWDSKYIDKAMLDSHETHFLKTASLMRGYFEANRVIFLKDIEGSPDNPAAGNAGFPGKGHETAINLGFADSMNFTLSCELSAETPRLEGYEQTNENLILYTINTADARQPFSIAPYVYGENENKVTLSTQMAIRPLYFAAPTKNENEAHKRATGKSLEQDENNVLTLKTTPIWGYKKIKTESTPPGNDDQTSEDQHTSGKNYLCCLPYCFKSGSNKASIACGKTSSETENPVYLISAYRPASQTVRPSPVLSASGATASPCSEVRAAGVDRGMKIGTTRIDREKLIGRFIKIPLKSDNLLYGHPSYSYIRTGLLAETMSR